MKNEIDFNALNSRLVAGARSLLPAWLPGGSFKGHEYVCGDVRGGKGESLQVNAETGKWADFAADLKGGDLVSLYAAIKGIGQLDAAKELGGEPRAAGGTNLREVKRSDNEPVPIMPAPASAPPLFKDPSKFSVWSIKRNAASIITATGLWPYFTAEGERLGYVARMDAKDGGKIFITITWCRFPDGAARWTMKAFPERRPLYGLDVLAAMKRAPVLLVEGEKSADAARRALGTKFACITWPGGAKGVSKADWSPLYAREVTIWPDADDAGLAAAEEIRVLLKKNKASVRVIDVDGMPQKWDAAEAVGDGWDMDKIAAWAKQRIKTGDAIRPAEPVKEGAAEPLERCNNIYGLPDVTGDKETPIETIENLQEVLKRLKVTVRYDMMRKEEEIIIPGAAFSRDNRGNASLAWLKSECKRFRMPTTLITGALTFIADRNPYNPMAEWILSKPWDGQARIDKLCQAIVAVGEEEIVSKQCLKEILIKRWMVSAIAAAFEPDGVSAHGVLVLQGAQYKGKTAFFKTLCPKHMRKEGKRLNLDDKDSIRQACSAWITELGELDATLRKSDIAGLKAFLTNDEDVMRRSYMPKDSEYARRTVFWGSVNDLTYLQDDTGNRRFWTIECESLNPNHGIDMQQAWAEAYGLYKEGYSWMLTPLENDALTHSNRTHEASDPVQELVGSMLDWEQPETFWQWKTATKIVKELGYDKPTKADVNRCAAAVRNFNGGQTRHDGRARLLRVPERKTVGLL